MIGKLKGLIDSYGEDFVILDVGGVGYQVHCSARTLQALPSPGEAAVLAIETYVREDQIRLFGFLTEAEARAGAGWRAWLAELAVQPDIVGVGGPPVGEQVYIGLRDAGPLLIGIERHRRIRQLVRQAQAGFAVGRLDRVDGPLEGHRVAGERLQRLGRLVEGDEVQVGQTTMTFTRR